MDKFWQHLPNAGVHQKEFAECWGSLHILAVSKKQKAEQDAK